MDDAAHHAAGTRRPVRPRALSALELVLTRLLECADDIASVSVVAVKERVVGYACIPEPEIHDQCVENVIRATKSLRMGAAPSATEISEASIASTRAQQGVPVEAVLQAYRVSLGIIKDQFLDFSQGVLPTKTVIDGIRVLWESADAVETQLAQHYQERRLWAERQDEQLRLDFFSSLLAGQVTNEELQRTAARYGLSTDALYIPIRARARDADELALLQRALGNAPHSSKRRPAMSIVDGDLVALAHQVPAQSTLTGGTVGIGRPTSLSNITEEWQNATLALETAVVFGMRGSHTLESLGLRTLIISEDRLGAALVDRYVAPLAAQTEFGDQILESVRVWLASGKNIARAADDLFVHPNTLRYRLRRFEEATEADLETFSTVVEVWWALERWRALGVAARRNAAPLNG